jgi:hypothetical protein
MPDHANECVLEIRNASYNRHVVMTPRGYGSRVTSPNYMQQLLHCVFRMALYSVCLCLDGIDRRIDVIGIQLLSLKRRTM